MKTKFNPTKAAASIAAALMIALLFFTLQPIFNSIQTSTPWGTPAAAATITLHTESGGVQNEGSDNVWSFSFNVPTVGTLDVSGSGKEGHEEKGCTNGIDVNVHKWCDQNQTGESFDVQCLLSGGWTTIATYRDHGPEWEQTFPLNTAQSFFAEAGSLDCRVMWAGDPSGDVGSVGFFLKFTMEEVPTQTPTPEDTATPEPSLTPTVTDVPTETPTVTDVPTETSTPTSTATKTDVPTLTPTGTLTPTLTPTLTATPGPSQTPSPGPSVTPSPTPSASPTPSPSPTPTNTPTTTPTPTPSKTPTITITTTPTKTPTNTPTPTKTPSVTPTNTPTSPPPNPGKPAVADGYPQYPGAYLGKSIINGHVFTAFDAVVDSLTNVVILAGDIDLSNPNDASLVNWEGHLVAHRQWSWGWIDLEVGSTITVIQDGVETTYVVSSISEEPYGTPLEPNPTGQILDLRSCGSNAQGWDRIIVYHLEEVNSQ